MIILRTNSYGYEPFENELIRPVFFFKEPQIIKKKQNIINNHCDFWLKHRLTRHLFMNIPEKKVFSFMIKR